jgi:hypothetical protein
MEISIQRSENRIRSSDPVEFRVVVDGKVVRAAVDWSTMEHLIGIDSTNEQTVHAFIQKNREGIELAIKAHLFAHGVPLTRRLVLTRDELDSLRPL